MSNILRAHFRESNSFKLFTELINAKQILSEFAYEFIIRLMSSRQNISFVSEQGDSHSFSNEFFQEKFLNSDLTAFKNENIFQRNKFERRKTFRTFNFCCDRRKQEVVKVFKHTKEKGSLKL